MCEARHSTAIRADLYYPQCKDSHTTYFEGVSTPPELPTAKEKQQTIQDYNQQQKTQYAQNQAKKCQRIAKYSLDEDNKRIYSARAKQWENKANIYNKSVVKPADSGIIKENSPRKTKADGFSVDWEKVQSAEYSKKFKKLSSKDKVSSAIETRAKWALNNRDGVQTEELYAVNMRTGEEVGRITNQHNISAVKRTAPFDTKLKSADISGDDILLIHNHPLGLPPSISDINALFENKNVLGITVGHNGSVYKYTKPKIKINDIDYNVKLRHYKNLDEVESVEQALFDLQEKFGFTVEKL